MADDLNTYNRRIQLGASRRRLEDAHVCLKGGRWIAAMYLGGYAIECVLKSYICSREHKDDFRHTSVFSRFGNSKSHNLAQLYNVAGSPLQRQMLDPQSEFPKAKELVLKQWDHSALRYSHRNGNEKDAREFVNAVEKMHQLLEEKCS